MGWRGRRVAFCQTSNANEGLEQVVVAAGAVVAAGTGGQVEGDEVGGKVGGRQLLDKGSQVGTKELQAQGLEQRKGQDQEQEEGKGLHSGGQGEEECLGGR